MRLCFSRVYPHEAHSEVWGDKAGIVIAQEAGGFATGSKDTPHDGVVTESILTGRRYLIIRGVAGTSVRRVPSKFIETRLVTTYFLSLLSRRRRAV